MQIIKNLLIILLLFMFSFSCSEPEKEQTESLLKFNIDSTLVTESISFDQLGFSIKIPAGWTKLDTVILRKIQEGIRQQNVTDGDLKFELLTVYGSDSTKSTLNIGEIKKSESLEYALSTIESRFSGYDLKAGTFKNNNITFNQFLIRFDNAVVFKLIFKLNTKIIQIDYTLHKQFYADEIKKVESSIGSIQPIN